MYSGVRFTGRAITTKGVRYHSCEFQDMDFTNTVVESCYFSECRFINVNFSDAVIYQSVYISCSFNAPNFSGARIVGKFKNCIIKDANCTNTDMIESAFDGGEFGFVQKTITPSPPAVTLLDICDAITTSNQGSADEETLDLSDNDLPARSYLRLRPAVTLPDDAPNPKKHRRKDCMICDECGTRMLTRSYQSHVEVHERMGVRCADTKDCCPNCNRTSYGSNTAHINHMLKCVLGEKD